MARIFEFVLAGKTLPADTYHVDHLGERDQRQLIIRGSENGTAMVHSRVIADRTGKANCSVLRGLEIYSID
jgi:hypothetical protein